MANSLEPDQTPHSVVSALGLIVRLSLLTMTSPNQMHEVLLFVCSKI